VQSIAANTPASNEATTPTAFYFPLVDAINPVGILSGNAAVCDFNYPTSSAISSVVTTNTINGSTVDTFTLAKGLAGAVNKIAEYYVNATAGAAYGTITFSGATAAANFTYACTEKQGNVSAVDETSGTASQTGPLLQAGALASLGASGDWIHLAAFPDAATNGLNQGTGYCAIGSGFYLDAVNVVTPSCTESRIYNSTASINPAITWPSGPNSSTASTNILAVAYESNSAGTAPSGMYVARETMWFATTTNGFVYGNCPASGNMMTGATSQGNSPPSLWDSNQDATVNNQVSAANTTGILSYLTNTALDNSSMCKFKHVNAGNDEELLRDIAGAATSSPLDTMSTTCPSPSTYGATGCYNFLTGVSGSNANLPNMTPSASNELVINTVVLGTGPMSALTSPTGATMICGYYTGMTDVSAWCSGNGHSAFVTTSGSALNWTWTNVNNTSPIASGWAIKP
jgi:hypothetical protein